MASSQQKSLTKYSSLNRWYKINITITKEGLGDVCDYKGRVVTVADGQIDIKAYDNRGAAQAIYDLEDAMTHIKLPYLVKGETKNKPLFIGRIDKFNSRLAVISQTVDEVMLYEGGAFAFVSEDDWCVLDENGKGIETERYGILVTGCCAKETRRLKFVKYDN